MTEREPGGFEVDKPRHECGVFGVYGEDLPVAALTYQGLQALNHRGQEGAGIFVGDGQEMLGTNGLGVVEKAFGEKAQSLAGFFDDSYIVASGHVRYGTVPRKEHESKQSYEERCYAALQPMPGVVRNAESDNSESLFALSHNGHIEDQTDLLEEYGLGSVGWASDTAALTGIIAAAQDRFGSIEKALLEVLPKVTGAFSLVISTPNQLYAARDRHGTHPLHIASYDGYGWGVASEKAALDITGAKIGEREIDPGELLIIEGTEEKDVTSRQFVEADPAVCVFEYVYFARPDEVINGETVYASRVRAGELLATNDTVEADVVVGVPQSGLAAANGYAWQRGMRSEDLLTRNNYVSRTFIAPNQEEREQAVHNKLNPIDSLIDGRRVIVVDDSIVRGTTTKLLVKMLKNAGASEVHLRIASPAIEWPCFSGIDTGNPDELLASDMSVEEMNAYLGSDSLVFLTPDDLRRSVGKAAGKVCMACITGEYPVSIATQKPN